MAQTKFSAGERVSVLRNVALSAPPGWYRVVSALPHDAGPQRYRIRNEAENFDRIVDEARLEAVSHD